MTDFNRQYPNGRLCGDDDGALTYGIAISSKTVIINFFKPVKWIGLDEDSAYQLLTGLANHLAQLKGLPVSILIGDEKVESPTMPIDRAKQIVGECVQASLYRLGIVDEAHDFPDYELEEILEANKRLAGYTEPSESGKGETHFMVVDPRGLAAMYALKHFQNSPIALLESLGYQLSSEDD